MPEPTTRPHILGVPFFNQETEHWCWAACAQMVIAYFRAVKFTPSQSELVELGLTLPKGTCVGTDKPDVCQQANSIAFVRMMIGMVADKASVYEQTLDADAIVAALLARNPVILHVNTGTDISHVMVLDGVRLNADDSATVEVLVNDPSPDLTPFWAPLQHIMPAVIGTLIVDRQSRWVSAGGHETRG